MNKTKKMMVVGLAFLFGFYGAGGDVAHAVVLWDLIKGDNTASGVKVDDATGNPRLEGLELNGSDIALGTVPDARLSANVTVQGNTFNGASQLVQLDGSGALPAVDGSALTGVTSSPTGSAGGDLSGTYPNPSVVDDSHNHGDSTVSDTLTIGAGSTVADGALSANVSLLGSTIGESEIENGAVTTAKLAEDSVTSDKILTGAVGASELASTAVTPNSYGAASQSLSITVDEDGRLTAASAQSISITESQISDLSHTVDTNANTICSGTTTYLDGEGNCDDLTGVYQPADADLDDLADGSLSGSKVGSGIDASNITTGTLPDARLSANVSQLGSSISPSETDFIELKDTRANICGDVPSATAMLAIATDTFDMYISTGSSAAGQYRNVRTGTGPC